mmetsp:Transcript_14622/g.42148  ORF Transcript_14622/g.42148 Transcript_14622/m.42148 type:complete len:207 (-) Transcript_14622:1325-1945(-)
MSATSSWRESRFWRRERVLEDELRVLDARHLDEALNRHPVPRQKVATLLIALLQQTRQTHRRGSCLGCDPQQSVLLRPARQKGVDYDHPVGRTQQVLLHQQLLDASPMHTAGVYGLVRVGSSGGLPFVVRLHHRHLQLHRQRHRQHHAALVRQQLGGPVTRQTRAQLLGAFGDELDVDLCLEERGDVEDALGLVQHPAFTKQTLPE